jgi:peptide subunit release factor 1 (eRF1)
MRYTLECRHCRNRYKSHNKFEQCSKCSGSRKLDVAADIVETAVDVAVAYMAVDLAMDVVGGVGDMIGGLFD